MVNGKWKCASITFAIFHLPFAIGVKLFIVANPSKPNVRPVLDEWLAWMKERAQRDSPTEIERPVAFAHSHDGTDAGDEQ